MGEGIEQEIIEELTAELEITDKLFNPALLAPKVKNAVREVRMRRNYEATSYSEKQIEKDLYNYYSVIKNLAITTQSAWNFNLPVRKIRQVGLWLTEIVF